MKKGIIGVVINHRKITIFLVCILAVLGLYNYYIIPKQETPDISVPMALITTVYPGAPPEDVQKLITNKIEDKLVETTGYDYCTSNSSNSVSTILMVLDSDADIEKSWAELRRNMDDIQSELPNECWDIEINTDLAETAGFIISMSGNNYSYDELELYAEDFKKELIKIDGISRFEIDGKQKKEVVIEVDINKLNFYNLSLDDITKIIGSQNVEIPSGQLDDGTSTINVKTFGRYKSINEIENTIIDVSKENGNVVKLSDIADVNMQLEQSNRKFKYNGENAVLLTGYFKNNKNIIIIGKEIENKINELKNKLPEDIVFDQVLYQPKDVSKRVNSFMISLIEGILFVVIIVFIGMGLRNAVIVSTTIPISILFTFSVMKILGIKVHQISIAGLIIALGMLVDNAIVVSDVIQSRIDGGEDKIDACIKGVKEVAIPVFTSTLTTIAAFMPLLLLSSIAGEYISSLPKIVIIALLASYLAALFVTPTMAYIFFRKKQKADKNYKIKKIFSKILNKSMIRKKTTVFITILVVLFGIFLISEINLQFFPKANTNVIYIDFQTEHKTDISKTEKLANNICSILSKQPEVINYTCAIGSKMPKFYNTLWPSFDSVDIGQIMITVDLKKSDRFKNNSQITDYLQQKIDLKITGGTATVKQLEIGEPLGAPIIVRVTGENIDRLAQVTKSIKSAMRNTEGTINITDNFDEKIYELDVNIDADKASCFGISKYDIQNEISIALRGRKASVFKKEGKEHNIVVKSNIITKEQLENLAIKSSYTGNKTILKNVADIELTPRIPIIKKYDREKEITINCDVMAGYNAVDVQKDLMNKMKDINFDEVNLMFDGEKESIDKYFGDIGVIAIFSLILIYLILLIQFKSFIQPLIILVTVPLSSVGSILGLYICRQPLSFTGFLGVVSLIGIVVNNAIVLVDYINRRREEGINIETSCKKAANKRFRPIILSTVTTVIGLIPLVFSKSELFRPMAVSLMFGLIISTLLTLIIIPVVYTIVEGKIEKIK